jgi:CBS domain containing-hemolysin-like protein
MVMTSFIFAVILLALSMIGVVVRKNYFSLPLHELKRRAERKDPVAEQLYRVAAYDKSLRGLLGLFIAVTAAAGFVLLVRIIPVWLSILILVVVLGPAFLWASVSKLSGFGAKITAFVTPLIAWLLNYLHPIFNKTVSVAEKRRANQSHTGIFERSDLESLIERQQSQVDNRVSEQELEIAKRALSFSEHTVAEVLTPRALIKTVLGSETVGPILIDELHQTEQEYVLVKDKPKGMIVGALELKDLGIHSTGTVAELMDPKIYYVHEKDTLSNALDAFYATNHPLFVVVNSFEEYVGIISVENILQQLLGHVPGDEFDQYADVAAVAARHPKKPQSKKTPETDI